MTKRMIAPAIFGLVGIVILINLGLWQSRRLAWKEAILADIEARMAAGVMALPARPREDAHEYLGVAAKGIIEPAEIHILSSHPDHGPGYRVIAAFVIDGRRVLLDRGFVPSRLKDALRITGQAEIEANLLWPDEIDPAFTPEPDLASNIWFARDVPALAEELRTEPVLLVARSSSLGAHEVLAVPVDTGSIPNNHKNYMITWFLLAIAWFGMTVFWLWRIRRRSF